MKKLHHHNIIRCFGRFFDGPARALYSILEYAPGGDLHAKIRKRRATGNPFTTSEILHIFGQILEGVVHLHEHHIIHRDLVGALPILIISLFGE